MPTYIKTDTDEALLAAMELSSENKNIHSVSTFPAKDDEIASADYKALVSDYEGSPSLPWENCASKNRSLVDTGDKEEISDNVLKANGSYELQQFGNLITNTKEVRYSQKAMSVMAKIISCAAFIALGHRRD